MSVRAGCAQSLRMRLDLPSYITLDTASVSGLPMAEASGRDIAYETPSWCSHFTPDITTPTGKPCGGQSKQGDQAGRTKGLHICQEKGGRRQGDSESF